MSIHLSTIKAQELSVYLQQETVMINQLTFTNAEHQEAFLAAVQARPALLEKVCGENAGDFLLLAIRTEPNLLIYIPRERITEELLILYLEKRFSLEKVDCLTMQKSLSGNLLFNLFYQTAENDELYYYDNELNIPAALLAAIQVTLKLVDPFRFIEGLDIAIECIGENALKNLITNIVVAKFRAQLLAYIKEKKLGYYTLCASVEELEQVVAAALKKEFENYGIEVRQFTIKKLAIPKDLQNKAEDLAFELRQRRVGLEAEAEFASLSLKNYEEKLAIQQKYPNATASLTEYEKDLALKRYLIKIGRLPKETLDRSIVLTGDVEAVDEILEKETDAAPALVETKKLSFLAKYILFTALGAGVSAILMGASVGVGLIALGLVTGVAGVVAAFNHKKFSNKNVRQAASAQEAPQVDDNTTVEEENNG